MKPKELEDLTVSALLLALAFGIVFSGGIFAFSEPNILRGVIFMSGISVVGVSSGFVLHEMGHRFLARRFGYFAEYVMWPTGLVIALVFSFFGFVFAAPGAVWIHPGGDILGKSSLSRQAQLGLISISGPVMNICLAVIFLVLNISHPTLLFVIGARINTWLAIFNLLPLGPLDGAAIFGWSKGVWLLALAVSAGLFVLQHLLF